MRGKSIFLCSVCVGALALAGGPSRAQTASGGDKVDQMQQQVDALQQQMKTVKDELAGRAVKCPRCGKPIRVPAPSPPPLDEEPLIRKT